MRILRINAYAAVYLMNIYYSNTYANPRKCYYSMSMEKYTAEEVADLVDDDEIDDESDIEEDPAFPLPTLDSDDETEVAHSIIAIFITKPTWTRCRGLACTYNINS